MPWDVAVFVRFAKLTVSADGTRPCANRGGREIPGADGGLASGYRAVAGRVSGTERLAGGRSGAISRSGQGGRLVAVSGLAGFGVAVVEVQQSGDPVYRYGMADVIALNLRATFSG